MGAKSFVEVSPDSHFPLENLPYGVFKTVGSGSGRPCVAIGDFVLDLSAVSSAGLFNGPILRSSDCFHQVKYNPTQVRLRTPGDFNYVLLLCCSLLSTSLWGWDVPPGRKLVQRYTNCCLVCIYIQMRMYLSDTVFINTLTRGTYNSSSHSVNPHITIPLSPGNYQHLLN